MLERTLQKDCLDWVKASFPDILVVNVHGGGWSAKGFPDLLLCIHGQFVVCELKTGSNDLDSAQKIWRRKIEQAGGAWYLIRELTTFKDIVEYEYRRNYQSH